MEKSKSAIWSFILSLIPMIWPIWYILRRIGKPTTIIMSDGTQTTVQLYNTLPKIISAFAGVVVLTSVITFWIGIIAIILGIVALIKIKKYNLRGKWFAIAGIIIGSIPAIIGLVFIMLNI